jgi:hypothetical protein
MKDNKVYKFLYKYSRKFLINILNKAWVDVSYGWSREYLTGKHHCTDDLLFVWFGLVCFANKNKNSLLSCNWFQTGQARGQQYSDTSPFSILWLKLLITFRFQWNSAICNILIRAFSGQLWKSKQNNNSEDINIEQYHQKSKYKIAKAFSYCKNGKL